MAVRGSARLARELTSNSQGVVMLVHDSYKDDFQSFNLFKLLAGTPIYKFNIFYRIKNILVRYDERTDYVNYGYWRDGYDTSNPSAELVSLVVSKLQPGPNDVLLNAGSGMGQPDVDIINEFDVAKIIGVNVSEEQVRYSNRKFHDLNLTDRVEHRVLDVGEITEKLRQEGITHVFSVEATSEFPDFEKFIRDCYELLPPGGRISICDVMRIRGTGIGPIKRIAGNLLTYLTTVIYGDHWRQMDTYRRSLENAGFVEIGNQSIGALVFPQSAEFAKERYHLLKKDGIPFLLLFSLT
jgi:cyclopropane fatty-acyl-phospholipid synthase-like methyltransferase